MDDGGDAGGLRETGLAVRRIAEDAPMGAPVGSTEQLYKPLGVEVLRLEPLFW